jgi:uncharacterized membrane protein YtjA (UPF0391 family)
MDQTPAIVRTREPGGCAVNAARRFPSLSNRIETSLDDSKEVPMLNWAILFFIIALIAAIFGFTGIASAAAGIAKILFFIFVVLFVLSLIFGLRARPRV